VFVYEPDGQLRMYMGGYSDYKAQLAAETAAAAPVPEKALREKAAAPVPAVPRPKKKLTLGEEKEYGEIEAVIASKEGELRVVELQMAECASDYGRLSELTREQQRISGELDRLMDRWAYLEEFSQGKE